MNELFAVQSTISLVLSLAAFVVKAFALADAATRKAAEIELRSRLSKQWWILILVLAVLLHILEWNPIALVNLAGTIAALVYLAQTRGSGRF